MSDLIDFDEYEESQQIRIVVDGQEVDFNLIDGSGSATSNRMSYERLKALELYNRSRIESVTIFDRKKVADHWRHKAEYFKEELRAHPENVQTLTEIIEACEAHYELHA